jgi:hypothetical protein
MFVHGGRSVSSGRKTGLISGLEDLEMTLV